MEARFDFLRPWCSPLRGLLRVDGVNKDDKTEMLLSVEPMPSNEATPERLRGVRDALVLLSLLSRVDPVAIKHVLVRYCDVQTTGRSEKFTREKEFHLQRFKFSIHDRHNLEWGPGPFEQLLSGLDDEPTAGLGDVVRRIAENLETTVEEFDVPIQVYVVTYLGWRESDGRHPILEALLALHDKNRSWKWPLNLGEYESAPRCAIKLDDVAFEIDTWTPGMLHQLGDLTTCGGGVTISNMSVTYAIPENPLEFCSVVQTFGNFFGRVYCGGGCLDNAIAVVESTWFFFTDDFIPLVPRMCTAVAEASTTTALTFVMDFRDDREELNTWLWSWLAFAAFSKHARTWSSLTHVSIEAASIRRSDIHAIAELLAAEDPLTFLIRQSGIVIGNNEANTIPSSRTSTRFVLRKGTSVMMLPMHYCEEIPPGEETCTLTMDVPRVVSLSDGEVRDEDTALALVPGYGLCQVPQNSLCVLDEAAQPKLEPSPLTSLSLDIEDEIEDPDEALPDSLELIGPPSTCLLELIGESLTRLKLTYRAGYNPHNIGIERILRCCPQLEYLFITGVQIDSSRFLKAYQELGMRIRELHCCFTDMNAVAKELLDRNSAFSRHIQSLYFHCKRFSRNATDVKAACEMVEALLEIHSPEYVQIAVPTDMHEEITSRFGCFIEQDIPVAREPFPLSCRLALVSAFASGVNDNDQTSKRPKMNSDERMLPQPFKEGFKLIFAFAAERVHRRIEVVPTWF